MEEILPSPFEKRKLLILVEIPITRNMYAYNFLEENFTTFEKKTILVIMANGYD